MVAWLADICSPVEKPRYPADLWVWIIEFERGTLQPAAVCTEADIALKACREGRTSLLDP